MSMNAFIVFHYSTLEEVVVAGLCGRIGGGRRNGNKDINTTWPESRKELYRPSDRRLSAKLVPTFVDMGCRVVSVTDPYVRILGFVERIVQVAVIAKCPYCRARRRTVTLHVKRVVAPCMRPVSQPGAAHRLNLLRTYRTWSLLVVTKRTEETSRVN
jgi:hypothetical protein